MTLTVRIPNFRLRESEFPLDWIPGEAFRSQLMNAFSLTFPIGEKFFINSVRAALPELRDPALREEVEKFIAQEAIHTTLHREMNARLTAAGLTFVIEKILLWRVRASARVSLRDNLATTLAYEHFTALMGDILFSHLQWLDGAPENLRQLWLWHAAEECEHKAVAFDVYCALDGGYWRRVLWFAYISLVFVFDVSIQTLHNLHSSGDLLSLTSWRRGLKFLLGRDGFFRALAPGWLSYFGRDFHPSRRGDDTRAKAWLADHSALWTARA